MGSSFSTSTNPVVSLKVDDPDATDKISSIQVMYGKPGSGQIATKLIGNTNQSTLQYTIPTHSGDTMYYYLMIVQADGDKICTSPIWIKKL